MRPAPVASSPALSISDPAFQEQFMDMLQRSSLSRELDDIKQLLLQLAGASKEPLGGGGSSASAPKSGASGGGAAAPPKKK
jgi:hypothetical protein